MIEFVLGLPRSGKSQWAELLLSTSHPEPTYVATLPSIDMYAETIEKHKARRGACWITLELSGILMEDLETVEKSAEQSTGLLIDGLSHYLLRSRFRLSALWNEPVYRRIRELLTKGRLSRNRIIVVDAPIPFRLRLDDENLLRAVHRVLANDALRCWWFEKGSPRQVTATEAVRHSTSLLPHLRPADRFGEEE